MKKHALLVLALASIANAADPKMFTVEVFAVPGGVVIARTVGPMTTEQCPKALAWERTLDDPSIPPSMQRIVIRCSTQNEMQMQLAAFRCVPAVQRAVSRHPEARMWLYGCVMG